jgi:ADP-ribose pyrophosphatase YjhB (NUDIX family)
MRTLKGMTRLPVWLRRALIRCAYVGLRTYWFVFRPNVTGVKCLVTNEDAVLLVRHTYGRRVWDLPGGTVRRGEAPIDTARREMREELGRRIEHWEDLGDLFAAGDHHSDTLHLFRTRLGDRRLDIDLTELAEANWFQRDELPPELGRFVEKILARAALAAASES